MKINYIMLIGIFILPAILTIFTMDNLILFPITHALWRTMEIGLITTLIFYSNYKKSIEIKSSLVNLLKNYKAVSLVVSYNEDPETVQNTLLSVKNETGKMGDVYLLDDSTHKKVEQNKKFCDENNIKYIHRENRRGYKAGALNDFLMIYGDNYDLISVFDLDQRPIKSFFYDLLPFFNDPKVAFV
ncbi:MAG: glycosyltransferase [Thermoplasmata archaeon]|nr:glycosyltransferase [Thermoplasmata archaeon]